MRLKNILYNSVTISLPKNIIQFFLGFVLYWLTFGPFDVITLGVALSGFLLAYSSVYFFNDIADYREDNLDAEKNEWKLVASGVLSKKAAMAIGIAFMVAGLLTSALVSGWFLNIMAVLIFLNVLHSSPYIKLKKRVIPTTINMTLIEFLKYSSGWFAFTGDLSRFPFWIIMTFSIVYMSIYLVYKFRFKGRAIKNNKWLLASVALFSAFSYILSIVLYSFALPLIILLAVSVILIVFSMNMGKKLKFMNWLWIEFIILPVVIIAFLLLSFPLVEQANTNITATIDQYKETVYKELPGDMADGLKNLSESPYDSLDDVQAAVNKSVNLSEITIFNS